MTTLAQARAELVAAIEAAGIRASATAGIDPPYVLVAGGGIDVTHIMRGQAPATFRNRCVAGAWDDKAAAGILDELKLGVLTLLRAAANWQLLPVGDDVIRDYAGALYLTADVSATRLIDI